METDVIEKISGVARVKADYAKSSFFKCFVYSMFAGAYIGIGITLICQCRFYFVCFRRSKNVVF